MYLLSAPSSFLMQKKLCTYLSTYSVSTNETKFHKNQKNKSRVNRLQTLRFIVPFLYKRRIALTHELPIWYRILIAYYKIYVLWPISWPLDQKGTQSVHCGKLHTTWPHALRCFKRGELRGCSYKTFGRLSSYWLFSYTQSASHNLTCI